MINVSSEKDICLLLRLIIHAFQCSNIGSVAFEALASDQSARVLGSTSRGVFIQTSGRWLVFLAYERFKGPLTLTLRMHSPVFDHIQGNTPALISSRSITIPDLAIKISTAESEVWQPPLAFALPLSKAERRDGLVVFATGILSKKKGEGLSSLLAPLLGMPDSQSPLPAMTGLNVHELVRLQEHLHTQDAPLLARQLASAMGIGPGLTPSSDDFIAGLLLALNRWHIPDWNHDNLLSLNHQIVESAYQKTTTLSANLIECAARGLANERLINALDWMVTGIAREPEIIDNLVNWGHSSGIDSFTGMAVALTA